MEKASADAYLAVIPQFSNRDLARLAASILGTETMHWAVLLGASYWGATSTTSPPTTWSPRTPRSSSSTSRGVRPPTSGVPVPGAKPGSTLSTSKDT